MKKKYYITTPIYYPSGKLHIGHAYTTIAGDVIKKYKQQEGYDVFYLTGTDEHGEKIEKKALANDVTPKEFVDEAADRIKKLWLDLGISYDKFIRTTDDDHQKIVQKIFDKLLKQGDIYKGSYKGLYCVSCETYVTETQAENNKCPDCGAELEIIEEETYFFKCSKYVDQLVNHMEANESFILPIKRKNEIINNFIKPGLEDLAVSRTSFKWGIPVKDDEKHVIYVWIDALSNYITALGYNTDNDELFNKYWPADVHLVGKEIIRFHVIYWPMILMALGLELPKQIFAHGWLLMDQDKMSKSKGNVIYPEYLIENYGLDTVRYYLMREVAFGEDGQFTPETFVTRINTELANDLGNLVNRTVSMTNKYFNGRVEAKNMKSKYYNDLEGMFNITCETIEKNMETLKFSRVLEGIWKYISYLNKYIDLNEPWSLYKSDDSQELLNEILFDLLNGIEKIAYMIYPVMPSTTNKILNQINVEFKLQSYNNIKTTKYHVIEKPSPIFPRLEKEVEIEKIINEMKNNAIEAKSKIEDEQINRVTFDEFKKVKIKVVEIKGAVRHEEADRLLVLKVDTSKGIKQIVAGIANYYEPETLIGKKVLCVDNLQEVEIRGKLSQGMLLTTSEEKGIKLVEASDHSVGEVLQ